ncbi:PilZ domain-containing protein [Parvibaculum sp.]|uniref:PilZ domain-containing protein n=1 Tax=Parvibaculum sp. TaxID=2024848 RepID=UPI00272F4ED7|nr:PilZ domain-containing protein [Parvibaculum sp.]MDP1627189.1 PilZ domain-containing protein [Parvibaculum sp.]MDP2148895.1 PilZ domain-containing protein [Parvibaculum sp.]MDP3329868.1 PilZ domain-containing protein [Parvibaculum sp.]
MQPDQEEERRRYPRVAVEAKGRFLAPDGSEHECSLRDISIGGIAVTSPVPLSVGALIIVYLDDFGRFEGKIARLFDGGFAIETAISGPRRERLQQRLEALARGEKIDVSARRAFARYVPGEAGLEESSVLTMTDGSSIPCRIIDMSLGGAQVAIEPRPMIGTHVSIGRMEGRVVRHTEEGVGIQFTNVPEHSNAFSRPFG